MKMTFSVKDMNCGHCKQRIENALQDTAGVQSFEVDLQAKTVAVESELPESSIAAVIVEAGYTPLPA